MTSEETASRGSLGIQSRLILLMFVMLIPIIGIQTLVYYSFYQTRKAEELNANLEVARAMGRVFDAFVEDLLHQELSIGLALTSLKTLTKEDQTRILNGSKAGSPAIWELFWTGPDGIITAATGPQFVGMNVGDRPYFQERIGWSTTCFCPGPQKGPASQ